MLIVYRFLSCAVLLATLAFALVTPDTAAAQDRRVRIINAGNVTVNSFQNPTPAGNLGKKTS